MLYLVQSINAIHTGGDTIILHSLEDDTIVILQGVKAPDWFSRMGKRMRVEISEDSQDAIASE
jgi:hypothetical protein